MTFLKGTTWRGFISCFLVSMGTIAFGYPQAIVGSTLAKPSFLKYMDLGGDDGIFPGKEDLAGTIASLFQIGAVVGLLVGSEVNDRYGRKRGVIYCSILSIVGGIGVTACQNMAMLLVFRFIAGGGSFAFLALTPGYISELASPKTRGFFGGLCGVFLGFGYCCASFMGLAFYYSSNEEAQWRAPLGIGLIWPILMLLIVPLVPESPRYLLLKGRSDEAWEVISKLHGGKTASEQSYARAEFYQMKRQADLDRTLNASWKQLFVKRSYRKRMIMATGISFLGQSSAVLVINNYGPVFYAALGFGTRDQLILQGGRDSIAFLGNFVGALLLDNIGRRSMLLTGFGGCIVSLCIVAAMVAEFQGTTNQAGLGVGVAALFIFLVFFAMGVDAPTYLYMGEIFPSHMRSKGISFAIAIYALIAIVYLQVTPAAIAHIGWKYFLVFICITAAGWVWMYFQLFETNQIPLEEMAEKFGDADEVVMHFAEAMQESNIKTDATEPQESETPRSGGLETQKIQQVDDSIITHYENSPPRTSQLSVGSG